MGLFRLDAYDNECIVSIKKAIKKKYGDLTNEEIDTYLANLKPGQEQKAVFLKYADLSIVGYR